MEAPSRHEVLERRAGRSSRVQFPMPRCYQKHRGIPAAVKLALWEGLGVEVHAADLGGPLGALGPGAVARAVAAVEKAAYSERAAASAAKSRYYGRPVNGSPPYGFVWVRQPGSGGGALVPGEEERALVRQVKGWHNEGHRLEWVRQHLDCRREVGFYKRQGRRKRLVKWTPDAIRRRILAEARLQRQEQEQQQSVLAGGAG